MLKLWGLGHSHWLALVTMTTVGFGDYTPKSSYGITLVILGCTCSLVTIGAGLAGVNRWPIFPKSSALVQLHSTLNLWRKAIEEGLHIFAFIGFFSFFGRHWYVWGLFCLQLALYSWPCQPLAAVIFAGIISCGFSAWSLWSSDFWWFSLKPWAGGYYWPKIFHLMGEQGPCHFALSATEVLGEVGLWSQRCCLAQFRDWAESQFGGNGEPTWTNPNPNSNPWLGFRLKLNPNP